MNVYDKALKIAKTGSGLSDLYLSREDDGYWIVRRSVQSAPNSADCCLRTIGIVRDGVYIPHSH